MAAPSESSPIETLPPELLSRTFALLSHQNPHVDIANARLVCRAFRALSSPYLLTTVVIAERKEALLKLRKILAHWYFRRHVTHLLWDASYWNRDITRNLDAYGREVENHPENSEPPIIDQQTRENAATFDDLLKWVPGKQRASTNATPLSITRYAPSVDDLDGDDQIFHRQAEGFAAYHRRYMDQESIRQRRLAYRYLHLVLALCPKLSHVSYTDHRALSRHGETYQQLCRRLFGIALRPSLMDELAERASPKGRFIPFTVFLKALAHENPHLKSFSIGHNNFDLPELPLDLELNHDEADNVNMSCILSALLLAAPKMRDAWMSILGNVRSLRLPVEPPNAADKLARMASRTADLLAQAPFLEHLGLATSRIPDDRINRWIQSSAVFSTILSPQTFKHLRSIELRGWLFKLEDLEAFLYRHHEHLRHVHIIGCKCESPYTSSLEHVKREWPQRLQLEAVEIVGLVFDVGAAADTHLTGTHICEYIVLEPPAIDDSHVTEQHPISLCPARRTEFESAMLGGRANNVSTQGTLQVKGMAMWAEWWEFPVHFC